ncbi:MAG: DMT family transporter [Alphaproteobacteria bacterium]|nr:DMT family transporter [Alphaproteobacteria bacterium]
MIRGEGLALLAAAATGVQVGAAMVATRFVVAEIEPASLAMLRYAIGVLCLWPFVVASRRVAIPWRDRVPIALLGIVQFGVLIAVLNWGLRYITSARAALLFATFPLMTMLLAALLGRERLTLGKVLGVALAIAGVGLALGDRLAASGDATREGWGAIAVLAAALAGAACSIFYRPYLARYPTLQVSAFAMLASVLALAIPAAGEGFFTTPFDLTPAGLGAILFVGVSSGIGYYLWLWALAHAAATRVSVFLTLSPITATLLGAAFLGEPVTLWLLIALVLVAGGLAVALRVDQAAPTDRR